MNIVYVTRLSKNKWAGPNTSVPKQIEAQSKIDNVFWYNVNDFIIGKTAGDIVCHCTDEYPSLKITDLPRPFNKPDLVIFESLYFKPFLKVASSCRKNGIPYIIIPRSSLTDAGQKSKAIKKIIGNTLFFNRFIKNAIGIQYLTEKEYRDSGDKWNRNNFVIPNGIDLKSITKSTFNSEKLEGIFIGRLDIYQKGLDLFLEACGKIRNDLARNHCHFTIFGPEINGSKSKLKEIIKDYDLQDIVVVKDAIFDDEKAEKLLESDFFILTSRFEGHPMGLIEALSYGLPSLITSGANMSEEIIRSDAGWTADISVDSIQRALKELLLDKYNLHKKSQNALKLSEHYNWNKLAEVSYENYKELLER
ncbi:MAG: glycosyltransferase [Tissierella sp.]|uniref:glycosyltransferase n=1 Tax=Tissierella sp. TaxID=41274 RepID=UPI003F9DA9A0